MIVTPPLIDVLFGQKFTILYYITCIQYPYTYYNVTYIHTYTQTYLHTYITLATHITIMLIHYITYIQYYIQIFHLVLDPPPHNVQSKYVTYIIFSSNYYYLFDRSIGLIFPFNIKLNKTIFLFSLFSSFKCLSKQPESHPSPLFSIWLLFFVLLQLHLFFFKQTQFLCSKCVHHYF